jgi:hypothetical protein
MTGNCKNCEKEFQYNSSQKSGIYCSNKCQGEYKVKSRFILGKKWRHSMRLYLISIRGNKCEECGIIDWNNLPLTMQVDHINGNRFDNRFENLKILCPNCHSLTDTYAHKNVSDAGKSRMIKSAVNTNKKLKVKRASSSIG